MLSRLEPTVTTQVLDTTAQILKLRTPTLMWVDPSLRVRPQTSRSETRKSPINPMLRDKTPNRTEPFPNPK